MNKPGRDTAVTDGTFDLSKTPLAVLVAAVAVAGAVAGVLVFAGDGFVACAWKIRHIIPTKLILSNDPRILISRIFFVRTVVTDEGVNMLFFSSIKFPLIL